ncbi:MAG: outer membrane beta-barrel protein [Betaproteobacteria bacterium]|nr:outer membrane beta-barrel protein [Betaproteobacteria bacterium]
MIAVSVLMPVTKAFALWGDKLQIPFEETITNDDNLFRISKILDPAAAIGSSSVSDTYRTLLTGFNLDVPVSRQRFQAGCTWSNNRYSRFSDLDYTGRDARAVWIWQFGNNLNGQLGYTETLSLASFAYIQARIPDHLKTRQGFLKATYLATPRWRVQTKVSAFGQTNSSLIYRLNDVNIFNTDVSVSYVTPAGNSVGLGMHAEDGRFPNRASAAGSPAGSPFDNAYRQYNASAMTDWTISGKSHVTAHIGRVSRHYDRAHQGDFEGNTASAEYDWKPTDRSALAILVRREISPYQDIQSNFALVKGVTLRPAIRISEKIDVSWVIDHSDWYFLGNPGLAPGGVAGRTDRVRSSTVTAAYRPSRTISLKLSVQRESRSSNIPLVDYSSNVISVVARIAF